MGGSDLSFSMLIRLMDGWSGPADKVRQSMRNMAQGARDMQRDMGRKIRTGFSADEVEAALSRSERRISQARGRLMGAAAMAVTLGAPVIQAGNFEEKLIDFANLAEIDRDRVVQLKTELNALRELTGQSNTQLLDGLATYVGKGMDLDAALAALPATGRAAKATKSEFDAMANSGYAVMDNLGVAPDALRQAFDIMAKSGKEGSFELAAMARKFPEITAGAKSLKMEGVDAVASLSAALQIAMKSAGSEDQAATNMTNFLGKITAPDTVRKFRKFGVDVEKEMRIALERGTDPLEHMLLVIKEMTDGDAFKMGELFADKQVLDFLRAMIPNMEEYQRIKNEALGADGVIDADYERVMQGFNEEFRQLKNSVSAMLGESGALLPIFTDIMREVRFGVEAVSAWTAANPELTATIVKGTAALLAFGIATRVVGFGFALMQGGILRTAALFLKFDKGGRNISLMGRSLRFAGRSSGFLYRRLRDVARLASMPFRWARFMPRFAWRTVITPLRWAAFLPKLAWRGLISPLRWAALLPKLSWRMLIPMLRWGLRFIPVIGWAALAGELLWHLLIKPLGWDKYIPEMSWEGFMGLFTWENVLTALDWSTWLLPIRWLDFIPGFKWKDVLGQLNWRSFIPRFRWRQRLRELDWRDAITPLLWSSALIPAIPWRGLAKMLSWGKIVRPLVWSTRLINPIPWLRLAKMLGWNVLIRPISWSSRFVGKIPWRRLAVMLSWKGLVRPLTWSSRFISAVPWRRLSKMLNWRNLVRPLTWGARFIPAIGWASKAGRLGTFGMNAQGWGKVITPLKWFAKAGLRFIGPIGWALFAYDLGKFGWDLVMNKLGWGEWINAGGLQDAWNALPTLFMSDKIKKDRPAISEARGFTSLPEGTQNAATEIDAQVRDGSARGSLATDEYTSDLAGHIAELGGQIAALETQLSIIKDGPTAETIRRPIREEIAALQSEMDWAQSEAAAAAARKDTLRGALTVTTGTTPVDGVTEASILAALDKVRADAANQADRSAGEAIEQALTPLTQAIRTGQERNLAPEVSVRPEARPEPKGYEASQPNVTVESTFESSPSIDVSVQVSMPISITRVQEVNNRALAARAGREAGAATERAVRRSLDDAANVE